jgi:hypothetical protein
MLARRGVENLYCKKRNVGKFQHKIAAAEEIIIPCLSPQIKFLTSNEKLFTCMFKNHHNLKLEN